MGGREKTDDKDSTRVREREKEEERKRRKKNGVIFFFQAEDGIRDKGM